MPPPLLIDLDQRDLTEVLLPRKQIYAELLPHRYEFQVLDGVSFVDRDGLRLIAFANIETDGWWVRGHIPGKPLLPGVLMLEMAGQAAAVLANQIGIEGFIGFGGVDDCKFRETVVPPSRLHILCVGQQYRPRRIICSVQGVVDRRLIFECTITGLIIR